ncbi:VanZ family protein [uncultured Clostridium sp.]|uniref:VanZ family protein n=1 Tax=uncultured Clostridium sp. TaxID=59620 RepID=UPI0034A0C6E0
MYEEFHQLYVKGRNGKVEDIVINFIVGIIGLQIYYLILKVKTVYKWGENNEQLI